MTHSRKFFFRTLLLFLTVGFIPFAARPVQGQGGIALEEPGASIRFGETITFHAKIKSALPIVSASILFRGVNQDDTFAEEVQVGEDGLVSYTYDASSNVFPPFSQITFWFQATLADGNSYASETIVVPYDDTRFPWSSITRANVTVHWYAGDNAFAARALDMAAAGMLEMRDFIPVSLTDPMDIYIYSNSGDLQSTLLNGGMDWVGGHTIPNIGVALAAIPPEADLSEFETKIPHEVAHVLLYRALGDKYKFQPIWLTEGIASMVEQYPNAEYQRALNAASEKDTLIPFTNLCESFPPDSGGVYLAYAQSQSFVTYIYESYGASGLSRLTNTYGDGVNCELGATRALGTPLSELDTRWRESVLGQNRMGVAARNLSPFVLIIALVLIVPLWGMIDLVRQRKKRGELYAEKPKFK